MARRRRKVKPLAKPLASGSQPPRRTGWQLPRPRVTVRRPARRLAWSALLLARPARRSAGRRPRRRRRGTVSRLQKTKTGARAQAELHAWAKSLLGKSEFLQPAGQRTQLAQTTRRYRLTESSRGRAGFQQSRPPRSSSVAN